MIPYMAAVSLCAAFLWNVNGQSRVVYGLLLVGCDGDGERFMYSCIVNHYLPLSSNIILLTALSRTEAHAQF